MGIARSAWSRIKMPKEIVHVNIDRPNTSVPWGFVIIGGKDQSLTVKIGKVNLQFVDLTLECLLDTESLTLGLLFSLQRSRHRFHGALVVLPGVVEHVLIEELLQ